MGLHSHFNPQIRHIFSVLFFFLTLTILVCPHPSPMLGQFSSLLEVTLVF